MRPQDQPSPSVPFQHPIHLTSGQSQELGRAGASLAWWVSPTSYSPFSAQWCSAAFESPCIQAEGRHKNIHQQKSQGTSAETESLPKLPPSREQGWHGLLQRRCLSAAQATSWKQRPGQLKVATVMAVGLDNQLGRLPVPHSTAASHHREPAQTPALAFLGRSHDLGFKRSHI